MQSAGLNFLDRKGAPAPFFLLEDSVLPRFEVVQDPALFDFTDV